MPLKAARVVANWVGYAAVVARSEAWATKQRQNRSSHRNPSAYLTRMRENAKEP
jgi:hypothetical protein